MSRDWKLYIDDMTLFCERVIAFTDGLERDGFEASQLNYDATVRNIELMGEAAGNVPDHVRQFASDINWRRVIAARNRLIHGYFGIDNDVLWKIIRQDIPCLLDDLYALKKAAEENRIQ